MIAKVSPTPVVPNLGHLAYPQGVFEKTHENIDLLGRCTCTLEELRAELNSIGGTVTEKG